MSVKRSVREVARDASPRQVRRGYLAEPYDGIAQYVRVTMSLGSTSAAIARVVVGGGYRVPCEAGTPISVSILRGSFEVVGLVD